MSTWMRRRIARSRARCQRRAAARRDRRHSPKAKPRPGRQTANFMPRAAAPWRADDPATG
ncbi:MAG TPA: hypothetical protein VG148_17985 [Pyrinomonadaceae bacterium]|nr:hypothetical protein [Pyrinomonadaceae bacterium]